MNGSIELRIRRQDRPETQPYWQTFRIPHKPGHNIVSALMMIRNDPVTSDGEPVEPVVWEFNCMEEVCGACSMIINGRPRQACSALVDELAQPIVLEPLGKFPVVRDLLVNRSRIFEGLKQVKAWVEIDGAWDVHQGAPPHIAPGVERKSSLQPLYELWLLYGGLPQFGPDIDFLGPAVLGQVRLMNGHPTGTYDREARLHAIMGDGGLSDCSNAQNCVQVCPKEIPLTTAIGELGRQVTRQLVKDILG